MHEFNSWHSPTPWNECSIYSPTSAYGHFGRIAGEAGQGSFGWEATDLIDTLISAIR